MRSGCRASLDLRAPRVTLTTAIWFPRHKFPNDDVTMATRSASRVTINIFRLRKA